MATLLDIKNQLTENKKATEDTTEAVNNLRMAFEGSLVTAASNRLEDIENHRELVNSLQTAPRGDRDTGDQGAGEAEKAGGGIFSGLMAALKSMAIRFTAPISALFAPLTGLIKLITGPVGRVVALLYAVFHDIGENPLFVSTIDAIKKIWNERILPTFQSIRDSLQSIGGNENVAVIIETALAMWENFRISIQNFVLRFTEDFVSAVAGIFEGIDQILKGDFIGGISTILTTLKESAINLVDNILTSIAQMFGADFGPNGSLLTWISTAWEDTKTYLIGLWDTFVASLKAGFDSFIYFFTDYIPEVLGNVKQATIEALQNAWSEWVQPFVDTITSVISFVTDNFGLMTDLVGAEFDAGFTLVLNGLKKAFTNVMAFVNTLGDRLYLMIAENLRFSIPSIDIPLPEWLGGGKFTLIDGFSVGVGEEGIAAARANIDQIELDRQTTVARLDAETAAKLSEAAAIREQLQENFVQSVVIQGGGGGGGGGSPIPIPVPAVPTPTVDLIDAGARGGAR